MRKIVELRPKLCVFRNSRRSQPGVALKRKAVPKAGLLMVGGQMRTDKGSVAAGQALEHRLPVPPFHAVGLGRAAHKGDPGLRGYFVYRLANQPGEVRHGLPRGV